MIDDDKEEKPSNINNKEKQYDSNIDSDALDMDLKKRLYYMFKSCNPMLQWDIVLDEFMRYTYPDLTPKQRFVYREIITTTWDLEFDAAPYTEVVVRVYTPRKNNPTNSPFHHNPFLEKKAERVLDSNAANFEEKSDELFEKGEDEEVEDVVNELCEKGIITSTMTTYNKDGNIEFSMPMRILCMRDTDRVNAFQVMSEVVNTDFAAYFPDVPHYKIDSNSPVEDSKD